jgi:tetratricopeptide (TPR) repeat protein
VGLFDVDAALADFRAAYDIAKLTQPAYASLLAVDIAQIYIRNQQTDSAIGILDEVLEQNPENSAALFWMGQVYFGSVGDPSQAGEYVQRCVDANPNSIGCWYLLGRTQARTDQLAAAAQSFARAIELGSTSSRHYYWAAYTEIGLGNCAKALEYMRTGYDIAVESNNTELISAFETIMPTCNADFEPFNPPTPTPTPEDTDGAA